MYKEVNSIITCDESWIYNYDVLTKSQRNIWSLKGKSTQQKQENPGLLERER